jgi:non-ribosomal peptide synthetase component F/thioesterase domain-containing protein
MLLSHEQVPPEESAGTAEVFVFPTTPAQRRFWMLDQLKPGNPALNIPLAARLSGPLSIDALERSVNLVLQRHEILRTSYSVIDGEVAQLIHPIQFIQLDRYDISGHPESEREAQVSRLMVLEGERPFSLSEGSQLRGGVIKIREDEHVLMLTMHHICADGWSNGILMREVAQAYSHLSGGPELPELQLQYADFAQWQQEWLSSPAAEEQRKYWLERLTGAMPVLNQPTDRPRRANSNNPGTIHTLLLQKALTEGLKPICQQENITPFMLFLAVYAILLYRYTGNTDIIVGSPAANRGQTELEDLIGLFSNPLVLRIDISGNPTFRSLLSRVRGLAIDAFTYQSYPFELLAEEIKVDPMRAGGQWLQAYFIYQKAFMVPQQMSHQVTLNPLRSISPGATFEWSLGVLERAEGTRLQLEYNTELYDEATIDRFLHHFENVLAALPGCLEIRVDELQILTTKERDFLLDERNRSQVDFACNRQAHELFEQHAERAPGSIAIVDGRRQLSYDEFNRAANRMAHQLLDQLGEDKAFVLLSEKWSVDSVLWLMAGLKAGVACTIVDPNWSFEHISLCLKGKNLNVGIAADGSSRGSLIQKIRWLDADPVGKSEDNPRPVIHSDQPACVRFSFRQGQQPAEVAFGYRSLLNGALGIARELAISGADRISMGCMGLQGMEYLLAALSSGASVDLSSLPASELNYIKLLGKSKASVLVMPSARFCRLSKDPSAFKSLMKGTLRLIVTDGRSVSKAAWELMEAHRSGKMRWLHSYTLEENFGPIGWHSPLETTQDGLPGWRVTVGGPAANTRIYLLDQSLQPVPTGVLGRIFIGGESLSLSSARTSNKLQEHFVHDPFSIEEGAILLRTEVFGRLLPSGGIELVPSSMESIAGWRLELLEIQLVLMEHPEVWDVMLCPIPPNRLTAYIVCKSQPLISSKELEIFCRDCLHSYMAPNVIQVLSELPLTADGQIDRSSLAMVAPNESRATPEFISPRTKTEFKMSELWRNLLKQENIGVRDNFFYIGGHSLLAARLFFRIEQEFGRKLPLSSLLNNATIEKLSSLLDNQNDREAEWSSLVTIQKQVNEPAFFCVHGAGGNILIYRDLAKHLAPHVAFYGLQSKGLDRKSPCFTRIEDMAAHYVKEIQAIQLRGPYYLGGYCMGGNIAFEMARILKQQGNEVALVAMFDSHNSQTIWERKSFSRRLSILLQKVGFHVGNITGLNIKQIPQYLHEKIRMMLEILSGRAVTLFAKWTGKTSGGGTDPGIGSYIQDMNHLALRDYQPGVYEGRITIFRPERNYSSLSDPTLGWGAVALGGIDTVELPVNPHAMLVEPYVKELAATLQRSIKG